MRKIPLFVGIALGAIVGVFTSLPDGLGLKIVMASIGAVAGAAIGGAFSRLGKESSIALHETDESFGQGLSARDRMRNFWRDKGKAVRFSEPPDLDGIRPKFERED